ncbi:MAG TPA: hypothetical protein VK996_18305 [Ramlibacter sp.]|nr:hypothetical protein [Ramlibacter sp.]
MKTKWRQHLHRGDLGDRLCCVAVVCAVLAGVVQLARLLGFIWRPM